VGLTRTEIIELANQLTERKGEKVLNLQTLYRFVVQDIAKRQRFWWRRGYLTFALTPSTTTYDLGNAALFPTLKEIAVEEITKFTLILSPNPYQVAELDPMFDPQTLNDMIANTKLQAPSRYTMDANDYKTLRIDPPDMAYTAYLVFWAMPNPASDSTNDAVPLIPPWGHNTIVAGMNAKIFKFAYGSKNEKTIDAQQEYEQGLQDLMSKKQFDPNYRSQFSLAEDAVRST
jgi:hypothetical protein